MNSIIISIKYRLAGDDEININTYYYGSKSLLFSSVLSRNAIAKISFCSYSQTETSEERFRDTDTRHIVISHKIIRNVIFYFIEAVDSDSCGKWRGYRGTN